MYNQVTENCGLVGYGHKPTLLKRLKEGKVKLSSELERVEKAIEALESEPKLAEVLEAVSLVNY